MRNILFESNRNGRRVAYCVLALLLLFPLTQAHAANDWYVITGSFPQNNRPAAERKLAKVQAQFPEAYIVNTNNFSKLRNGLWAVVLGPYDKATANRMTTVVRNLTVPDAYLKQSSSTQISGAVGGSSGNSVRGQAIRKSTKTKAAPPSLTKNSGPSYVWKIIGYKPGPIYAMTEAEAKAYLNKQIILSPNKLSFNGEACTAYYNETHTNAAEYFAVYYKMNADDFGFGPSDDLTQIETGCDILGMGEFIVLYDGRMVTSIDGMFLFMEFVREQ